MEKFYKRMDHELRGAIRKRMDKQRKFKIKEEMAKHHFPGDECGVVE